MNTLASAALRIVELASDKLQHNGMGNFDTWHLDALVAKFIREFPWLRSIGVGLMLSESGDVGRHPCGDPFQGPVSVQMRWLLCVLPQDMSEPNFHVVRMCPTLATQSYRMQSF